MAEIIDITKHPNWKLHEETLESSHIYSWDDDMLLEVMSMSTEDVVAEIIAIQANVALKNIPLPILISELATRLESYSFILDSYSRSR